MKFKKGDRVYSYTHGWGEIESLVSVSAWIEYDSGLLRFTNTKFISFTEYDLESGGFSQERPEPKLEVGKSYRLKKGPCVVICKRNKYNSYGIQADKWSNEIKCSVPEEWQEIPESEAIELLERECVRWGGEGWKDAKVVCLYSPEGNLSNTGKYITSITTYEIWNKNGCIFKDGVWAEKLEEPDIKEGQMIWVRDREDGDYGEVLEWQFVEFVEIEEDTVFGRYAGESVELSWDEYSILNPYHDSIEARAIELLRKISENTITRKSDIIEFIDEIENYQKQ